MDQGVSKQCSQSICVQQKIHCLENGFWVASLVLISFDIELGRSSIKNILDNISLFHEDFPLDGQPGQPPSPLHPLPFLPRWQNVIVETRCSMADSEPFSIQQSEFQRMLKTK